MRAVDTNVILRFLIGDDPRQAKVAERCVADGIFVSHGVLMEAEWVMRAGYRLNPTQIADLLSDLLEIACVEVDDREELRWAIERHRQGADWADLLHLIACRAQPAFATFDRTLAREAGPNAPVSIELLT
ncbi:MAG: type II toxin-antitoxin system VapC family toxin [Sphingomonadaceae bacterium]|nr:type II toxin-antitoxin system VapC family toxin [Sphingomonadaceae bacterium]